MSESALTGDTTREILAYWFDELDPDQWYAKDAAVDEAIRSRFGDLWADLNDREPDDFLTDIDTARAAVILFDQFPRNMFRDDPKAFASDDLALAIATGAVKRGWDRGLPDEQRQFLYMPFMHAEDLGAQQRSIGLFSGLGGDAMKYAIGHYDMIERFGRFPHRNELLGRETTPIEKAALAAGNSW